LFFSTQDGLAHQENVALRDFSAVCLKEFIVWTFKQPGSRSISSSQVSLEALMTKIFLFSKHPCQFKRLGERSAQFILFQLIQFKVEVLECVLRTYIVYSYVGAALAISSLYPVLREQKVMDDHWLELLYYMVNSLMLCDSDEQLVGTEQQTLKALMHIERVLREKASIFSIVNMISSIEKNFNEID
jgi:DNA-dependent protein kinase catalytic subunit